MAIVRILNSSSKFSGVAYNDDRCSRGEAELTKAVNFKIHNSIVSYTDYLLMWSSKNKRIKNTQFHAIISLEKDELTKDELVELGEKWLKEMGYSENPYLIYFHKNTAHPHIHIVTSRVDKNGNKISDKFEKERAVQVLNKIDTKLDYKSNRKLLSDLLHYSFSTKYQFFELCKGAGFKIRIHEQHVEVIKDSISQKLSNDLIEFCSGRYRRTLDAQNTKRIQSLIYKYAQKYSKDNFIPYMRKKFGLEFIFYGKQGDINGYTIIDYKNHSVYKGSEIFGAKKISELFDIPQKYSNIDLLIQDILGDSTLCDLDMLNETLNLTYFYSVDNNYNIKDMYTGELVGTISDSIISQLEYNKRVRFYADKFKPYNNELSSIIARFAKVKVSDMNKLSNYPTLSQENIQYYSQLMADALNSKLGIRDYLNYNNLTLVLSSNQYYLIDPITGVSISGENLSVKYSDIVDRLRNDDDFNQDENNTLSYEYDDTFSFILNPVVFDFSGLFFTGHLSGAKTDKKKKRHL